jgi:TPR repeat protein
MTARKDTAPEEPSVPEQCLVEDATKTAEQGDADEQFFLGLMYSEGYGIAQDYAQAEAWFRKAAEQGHTDAQHFLDGMYAEKYGSAAFIFDEEEFVLPTFVRRFSPADCTSPELLLAFVRLYPLDLQHVQEAFKTPEICLAAVCSDGRALKFVPEALKTKGLCRAAVRRGGRALQYVPKNL